LFQGKKSHPQKKFPKGSEIPDFRGQIPGKKIWTIPYLKNSNVKGDDFLQKKGSKFPLSSGDEEISLPRLFPPLELSKKPISPVHSQ